MQMQKKSHLDGAARYEQRIVEVGGDSLRVAVHFDAVGVVFRFLYTV